MTHTRDRFGKARLIWTPSKVSALCELVSDGFSMRAAAVHLGCTQKAAEAAFDKVRREMGWQEC